VVKLLIKSQFVDFFVEDSKGQTALMLAISRGYEDIDQLLQEDLDLWDRVRTERLTG
jgi:ankyrin repeat protein